MYDLCDSPAWQSLPPEARSQNSLVFSFFADWLNPMGNRIAGKKISSGLFMKCCYSLPPSLRYRFENMCFLTLSPRHESTTTTISHLLDSNVDELAILENGVVIPTFSKPSGRKLRVYILPHIFDLPAMMAFASHSANQFCSYCTITKQSIEIHDTDHFPPRDKAEVLRAAQLWRSARTEVERKRLFR